MTAATQRGAGLDRPVMGAASPQPLTRSSQGRVAALTSFCILLGLAVAACGGGSPASLGTTTLPSEMATGTPAPPSPDPTPTDGPSPKPEPSPVPEPPPTPEGPAPCDGPFPSATPRPTDDPRVAGVLVMPGGVVVPGILGTNIIDQTGSDAPWIPFLPARAVSIEVGVPVTIRLGDGSPIGSWSVELAGAADRYPTTFIGLGFRESALPPLGAVEPKPLPAGCWVLEATLSRADGRGSGATYWSVSVSP